MSNDVTGIKTEKLYYDNFNGKPYKANILKMRILPGGNTGVILDKTIFFPDGGGQPADRGTVSGVPLLDVYEKDGEIFHLVSAENAALLKTGPAELVLDSRRRYEFSQLHTGQHLLSGIILNKLGAPTVSVHLGEEVCTIDVDTSSELKPDLLTEIEEAAADAIAENRKVTIHLCPPENIASFPLRKIPPIGEDVIRIVEIEGYDIIACCGTHLESTAEIGLVRVLWAEKYKGMNRIGFLAGRRILSECRMLRHNAGIVSRALSVPLGETGKGVLDLHEKLMQTEKRLHLLEEKEVTRKAAALLEKAARMSADAGNEPQNPAFILEKYADEDMNEVLNIGRAVQKNSPALLILASLKDLKFAAFCGNKNLDVRSIVKTAFNSQGGRGGGSASFFQGSFGTKEAMEHFLNEMAALLIRE
jgi:alanyl-tRNA synthetase